MSSVTLTTSYNTLKVVCNNKTIKQIWIKEGGKDAVQVYQAWKTETYQKPSYSSRQGLRGSAILKATSTKVLVRDSGNYVIYKFEPIFYVDNIYQTSSAAYIKFVYYNPSGTAATSYTATSSSGTGTKLDKVINYTTVYSSNQWYDQMDYKGHVVITPSKAVVTSTSASTTDGSNADVYATAPRVTDRDSYSKTNSSARSYVIAYEGITTYSTATRNVEDND